MTTLLDEFMGTEAPSETLLDEFMGRKPSPARMEMAKPVTEMPLEEERLKMLEVSELPITTPRTPEELIEPAMAIPKAGIETALAMGTGVANFMLGFTGWRMIGELLAGTPLEEVEEKGGGGLWTYEPKSEVGQQMTEMAGLPFKYLRKGVEKGAWNIVKGVEIPELKENLTQEQLDYIAETEKVYPHIATALGTIVELGAFMEFGHQVKRMVGSGKPTPTQIVDAAKEAVKLRKAGVIPKGKLSPEARALSKEILDEMYKREPTLRPRIEPEIIYKPKEVKRRGRTVLEKKVEEEPVDISPVRKTEEGLPITEPEPIKVPKPPKKKPIVEPDITDPKVQKAIDKLDAQGKNTFRIADDLGMHEYDVASYLESKMGPKKTVTMEDVEAEGKKIIGEAKNLDKAYEGIRELATRYEENLHTAFSDKLELIRYREWGDNLLDKIRDARKKGGMPEDPKPSGETVDWFGEDPPTVTTDFMGFQKMYEDFVNLFKAEYKEPLSPQAEEMFNRGAVIKQRRRGKKIYPPVYEAKYQIIKNANVLDETFFRRAFTNPIRVFEEAGGEALKSMTIHPYHAAEKAFRMVWDKAKKNLRALEKTVGSKEKRRIMAYAVSQQPKGDALLSYMKIKKVPKLTPKEMEVYNALRQRYENLYTRLNRVRRAIGLDEFPHQENYFTFFRDMTVLENMGFQPLNVPTDVLNAAFVKLRATPFKYAKARTRAIYRLEMDPFYVLSRYTESALRHIHISPLVAELREYLNVIKDPVTNRSFSLQVENPVLAKALTGWLNHIAGMRHPWSFGPRADAMLMRINSNLTASILGANVRSAMIQVSALRNTFTDVGLKYTLKGIESLISPAKRNFAMKKSKVLKTRAMDVSVNDAIRAIRIGRIGEARAAVGRAAMKPLQVIDLETAKATWQAYYEHGIEQLKLSSKKAITYADDGVTKSQASALPGDIAPAQRFAAGKVFTLFQTFTINDWNFLIRDVLGARNATVNTPKAFAKVMRYVAATTAFNILFEDILHINSPFPTPIRAFKESVDRGDDFPSLMWNVSKEFIEPIPIIGAARYGLGPGGPGLELANETVRYLRKDPMRRPFWAIFGRWIGLPGTAQYEKMTKAQKRRESFYGAVVGTYTPPAQRRRTRKEKRAERISR